MADENVIGSATVAVGADLSPLTAGFSAAEAQTRAFDARMAQSFTAAAAAARTAGGAFADLGATAQRNLIAIANSGATLAQYQSTLSASFAKTADGAKQLAAYEDLLTRQAQISQAATAAQTTTLATNTTTMTANAAAAKAAAAALDAYSAAQLRSRVALTAQQNAGTLTGGAGRADAAAAAATLAFQMRMQRQQAAEAAAAAKATQVADATEAASMAALAANADALKAKLNPLAAIEARRAEAIAQLDTMLAKSLITQEQYTAALALTATEYDAEAAAAMKAATATEGFTLQTTLAARETAVLGREALRGNWSRMVGSITLLASAFNGLPVPILAGAAALAVAVGAEIVYEQSMERLRLTLAGVGAQSGLTATQLESAAEQASGASSQSIYATRASAEAFAAAGVTSQQTITDLSSVVAEYAALTGTKAAQAQKTLAEAMEDPSKAARGEAGAIANLTGAQVEEIDTLQRLGDKEKAAEMFTRLLKDSMEGAAGSARGMGGAVAQLVKDLMGLFDWVGKVDSQIGALTGVVNAFISVVNPILGILPPIAEQQAVNAQNAAGRDRYGRPTGQNRYTAQQTAASRAAQEAMDANTPGLSEYNDWIAERAKLQAGLNSGAPMGSTPAEVQHRVQQLSDTIARRTKDGHFLSLDEVKDQELIAEATLKAARAHHAKKDAIEADAAAVAKLKLAQTGEVLTDAEAARRADLTGDVAGASAGRGKKGPKDTFTPEEASVQADTAAYLRLATAYGASASEAIRLEAEREALTKGALQGRNAAQQEIMVQNQINLDVAKIYSEQSKLVSGIEEQAVAQRHANEAVAAGALSRQDAQRAMKEELALLPLTAAAEAARGPVRDALNAKLREAKVAQDALNAAEDAERPQTDIDKSKDEIDLLKEEYDLRGASRREREMALARTKEAQALGVGRFQHPTDDQAQAITQMGEAAGQKVDISQAQQYDAITKSVREETAALNANAATIGMSYEQAQKYKELQKLLNQADKDGIQLTDDQRRALDSLAGAYASAAEHAKQLADAQKGAREASDHLAEGLEHLAETAIFDSKNLRTEVRALAIELGKDALKAALTGQGPFAGVTGTNQSKVEGGPNKGILSKLMGGLFGEAGSFGHDRPTGRMADPIYVAAAAGALGGLGGLLKSGSQPVSLPGATGQLVSAAETQFGLPQVGLPGTSQGTPDGSQAHPFYVNVVNGGAGGPTGSSNPLSTLAGGAMAALGGGIASLFGMGGAGGAMGGLQGGGIGGFFQRLIGGAGTIGGVGGGSAIAGATGAAAMPADLAGLYHTGTSYVGTPTRMIPVNPNLFVHAPRLHSGLAPDEFPAILQRGEGVTRRGGSSGRGSTSVTINVHGVTDGASFSRSQGQIARETNRRLSKVR